MLALWKFQGLLAGELFVNLLAAIEERLVRELRVGEPGRYRDQGYGQRQWHLPFGTVRYRLRKLKDLGSGKVFSPLREAVGIPDRVRWCEESLLPGYRLGILQSFRKSARTVARENPPALARAIESLLEAPALRRRFGEAGRSGFLAGFRGEASVRRLVQNVYLKGLS